MFIALSSCNFFRHIATVGNKISMYAFVSAKFSSKFSVMLPLLAIYKNIIWYHSPSAGLDAFIVFQTIVVKCATIMYNMSHPNFPHRQLLEMKSVAGNTEQ